MNKKRAKQRKLNIGNLLLPALLILAMLSFYLLKEDLNITGFAVLQTLSQTDFNTGTYNETFYNTTTLAVQLNMTDYLSTILSGNYTSAVLDASVVTNWRNLSWTENITNRSGNVSFRVRSCLTSNCVEQRPFVGPDNTSNTNFWQGNYSILNNTVTPDSRYFQYMAFFATLDNDSSSDGPVLYNVSVDYGDCVEPINDMYITESTTLCSGTFYVNDTDGDSNVITVSNDSVFVTCNKTVLVGNLSGRGFELDYRKDVTISGCFISNYTTAIRLFYSNFTTFAENNLTNMSLESISITNSHHNLIFNNTITFSNGLGGSQTIGIGTSSTNNTIKKNLLQHNLYIGITAGSRSDNNTLVNNTIINNTEHGIRITGSLNITITNNTIAYNDEGSGIYISGANDSLIYSNYILDNGIIQSGRYGIDLTSSSNNSVYNNVLNATRQNVVNVNDLGNNHWNISNYSGTNIINGPMIGGNYYSDYGFYDYDGDGDGFGELSYTSGMNNSYDMLPLSNNRCLIPGNGMGIQRSVVLCPDTYDVVDNNNNGLLNITNSSVILECNQTRIRNSGSQSRVININPGSGQLANITIKNCYFETTGSAIYLVNTSSSYVYDNVINMSGAASPTMYFYNVNYSIIANNTITNTSAESIYINDASHSIFENNTISKAIAGVLFSGTGSTHIASANITFKNNLFNHTSNPAISATANAAVIVNDSKFYNNTFYGIGDNSGGPGGNGCIVLPGFSNEFIGNTFINCSGAAISSGVGASNSVRFSGDNYYIKSNIINGSDTDRYNIINLMGSNISIINNTILKQISANTAYNGRGAISLNNSNNSYIINNTIANITYGIFITGGNYQFSALYSRNITISGNVLSNITLIPMVLSGDNITVYNNTILSYAGPLFPEPAISARNLNNSRMYNNTIYRYTEGIAISNSENLTITNNSIYENLAVGINITSSKNVTIFNNVINNNTYQGVLLLKSSNVTIEKNIIFNNSKDGISANFSNYTIIFNNTIRNNVAAGISLFGSNSSKIINNSIFNNGRDGIYIEDSEGISILDSWLIGNSSRYGIFYTESSNITIARNTISNNSRYGIAGNSSNSSRIENNTIRDNVLTGISLFGTNNTHMFNNSIFKNRRDGIYIEDSESVSIISHYLLSNNSGYGIYAGANNITIYNNQIFNSSKQGIFLLNSNNITIEKNTIYESGLDAIALNSSNFTVINNNTLYNNTKAGISLFGSNYSLISNNTIYNHQDAVYAEDILGLSILQNIIYNSSRHGIYDPTSFNITISNNIISNNSDAGISLLKTINSTITNNIIYNNSQAGIRLNSSNYSIIENNNLSYNGIISYVTEFYMSAVVYRNDALGAIYNDTAGSTSGHLLLYQGGDNLAVATNNTNVSALINGTANLHLALVKLNSSDAGLIQRNITIFFDNSIASSCLSIAQFLSDVSLASMADETNCTYFQADIFTANGNNNYTYNDLTNATITQDPGTLAPSIAAVSTVRIANLIITESSDTNITNNTMTLSSGYGVILDTANNTIFTNNTILSNVKLAVRALGDSSLINKVINSTNVTTSVASSILEVYWFLKAYAHDNQVVFSSLNISFYNKSSTYIISALTDASGYTPELTLVEYEHSGEGKVFHTNYMVNATRPVTGGTYSQFHNLTSSGLVDFELHETGGGGGGGGGGSGGGCTDDCSSGEKRCSSSTSYETCGSYDDDSCLEYGPSRECSEGLTCSNGNCVVACTRITRCTEWSVCKNEKQTRSCAEINSCSDVIDEALEERPCKLPEIKEILPELSDGPEGASKKEHNATKCFESRGLSKEEIVAFEDLLEITPCEEEKQVQIKVETRQRCNGIEINVNDASLNIVYKEKPNFYLNFKSTSDYKEYCPWCFNSKQDYDETSIDCGGSCKSCLQKNLEIPYRPPKPDYRLPVFVASSAVAAGIGCMLLLRRKRY